MKKEWKENYYMEAKIVFNILIWFMFVLVKYRTLCEFLFLIPNIESHEC